MKPGIGTLNEKPLHEALKRWYTRPGDKLEVPVDGYVIDIVRRSLLVEIQTRSFAAIRHKLEQLLAGHRMRLVYPIALQKWIVRQSADEGGQMSRRRSPKRGDFVHIFDELVSCPRLFMNPRFSLELLLIQEEEVRHHDARRRWRRGGWVTCERRFLEVVDRKVLRSPRDLVAFIPCTLIDPFTTSDLAASIARPRRLAQKMAYCLRSIGSITPVGKRGNAVLYVRAKA